MTTKNILENAKRIKNSAAALSSEQKNSALINMAQAIEDDCEAILRANNADFENSRSIMSDVMLDRLALNEHRIHLMAAGLRSLAKLDDPVGKTLDEFIHENGMKIKKVSVPLGVVAIIYESRPNVTVDAAALALKSGNVCILKIGKEAYGSARALVSAMHKGLKRAGVSRDMINLVEDTSRASANELMKAVGYVDLLIPRGGKGLIDTCVENARVPCIQTGTGICHIYVDGEADINKALSIVENAKCSRPSVCNAMEVLLVSENIASEFLNLLYNKIVNINQASITLKLDVKSFDILGDRSGCELAGERDFDIEFLDYVLAVKTVKDVKEAVSHINAHSTGHSDGIITENIETAEYFTRSIDSAAVYVNSSTRFTDGGEFGLGCEMGISTQKLHARGPMGLKELTSYKYVIIGSGQIRR